MVKRIFHLCVFSLVLCCVSSGIAAQGGVEDLVTLKNQSATYQFISRLAPVIGQQPDNGTVKLVEDPVFNYTLTYTPDEDHIGTDNFTLVSFPFGFSVSITSFAVDVKEAIVVANHDLAQTASGISIRIPVLMNDETNTGFIEIGSVPVANGGGAVISGSDIVFTPAPGFVGLADFNYTACTYNGSCDLGTATVNVVSPNGESGMDTVRVFTKRDQPQLIFAPMGTSLLSEPKSGEIIIVNGVEAYQPDAGFVGDEFLVYQSQNSGSKTTFHVSVLDLEDKKFTTEDRAFTSIDAPVTFSVLNNDLYSVFADCVSYGAPRFGTLHETGGNGKVTYTPPTGWSGVDQFTYSSKAPGCEGPAELQTAYIIVSNFAPSQNELELTLPVEISTPVTYSVPNGTVKWTLQSDPLFGTVTIDELSGEIIYTGNSTSAGQTDKFLLDYCLNLDEDGFCQYRTSVDVVIHLTSNEEVDGCEEDCVWPGDTNRDGVVDVSDLLPLGLNIGRFGTPRLNENPANWNSQTSEDWNQEFNDIDLKHIDANGDQVISHLDTQVILRNMGLTHQLRQKPQDFVAFDISLRGNLEATPGDLLTFDIVAGSNIVVVEDVFGFTFPFEYDQQVLDGSSVNISFEEDSWIGYDSPLLSLQSNNTRLGRVEAALARTNREAISGFGRIGELSIVVVEDVFGFQDNPNETELPQRTITLGGQTATAMNGAGHLNAVRVNPVELTIKQTPPVELAELDPVSAIDFLEEKLLAFPNPTGDRLTVHLNGQQRFSALQLTDLTGRVLLNEQGLDTNHRELNLASLPNGVYTLTLTTEDGVVNRKIEKL